MNASIEQAEPQRRPGRWRTGAQSRDRILTAARACFARYGYDRATVRQIAREAQVDSAMVHYFFGKKSRLFVAAMELPVNPTDEIADALDAPAAEVGERIVRHFLAVWDAAENLQPLLALMRSAGDDSSVNVFSEYVRREITARLAAAATGEDPDLRADLVGAHLMGLALARYVIKLEPLASSDPAVIAAWIGPSIQRYLTAPEPPGPAPEPPDLVPELRAPAPADD